MEQGLCTVDVRLSAPAWAAAAGLLLWARRGGDVDRFLQQRRAMRAVPCCQRTTALLTNVLLRPNCIYSAGSQASDQPAKSGAGNK